jgi:hypothetical protein
LVRFRERDQKAKKETEKNPTPIPFHPMTPLAIKRLPLSFAKPGIHFLPKADKGNHVFGGGNGNG